MPARRPRVLLALTSATALALALVVLPGGPSAASDPGSSALTVPTSPGQKVAVSYTGTAQPDASGAVAGCSASNSDTHELELTVPSGALSRVSAVLSFDIAWEPSALVSDLILEVRDGAGNRVGRSDGGSPSETVTLTELAGGTYTAFVCGFANEAPQPYDGTITITTSAVPGPVPPTVNTGLEFSASLVTDPQRSQGEAAAFADRSGVLYSCGTNGASNGTDHGSVSVDGGRTWRPLGTPPLGETGTVQGGGDCAIGTGQDLNEEGNRQLAFIGLGPLTGFSTFSSPDNGRTLQRSPDHNGLEKFNQTSLVDRQWLTFTDDKTVFLNYNAVLDTQANVTSEGQIIQKSTDGGLTYGPQYAASTDGRRLGQIQAIPEGVVPGVPADKDVVYFPYSSGEKIKLAMSLDGGESFSQCLAVDAGISPDAGFVAADHDKAGNIYVTYTEKGGGRDTYLVALRAQDVARCKGPHPVEQSAENNVDPGFTPKIRINREGVETTVMPWVAAGGAPGRVAVAYYGTPSVGDPDSADFKATWHVYVNQTINAFAAQPNVDQVQATTHPNHYDSICLNGLACTLEGADRSLVDYFTMTYDPASDRLLVVYNQAAKKPDDATGRIAAPVALVQRAGQTHGGKALPRQPKVVRTGTADAQGDAFARWTTSDGVFGSPTTNLPGDNLPATDIRDVQVGPEVDLATGEAVRDGGFTVTMTYDDLSDGALQSALTGGQGSSLVYLFRFFDGYQPGGAAAFYEPLAGGWRFGYDDYTTTIRNPQGNLQTYKGSTPIQGQVDQEAGTITLSVPRSLLEALEGPQGPEERPAEVPATLGSRIYDASAWSFTYALPTSRVEQTFMTQTDNTEAFDFVLTQARMAPPAGVTPVEAAPVPAGPPPAGGRLPATGGLGVPLLAIALLTGAGAVYRRRRDA
jgi:hypothetical protein